MATKINFYLNETYTKFPPKNWKELGLELNFDKDKENVTSQVSITDFEFVRENSDIINEWIIKGLTTGVGVFEGIPFRIEVARNGVIEVPFKGYLDLTQQGKLSKNRCTVRAVEENGIDSFNDKADGFSYQFLYDNGRITDTDFIWVPYVLNSVPNYVEACVSVVGVYVMVKEIKEVIQKLIEFVSDMPVYYVFSTYIKLILYIIYLILLIIALIKLVKAVVLLIIQPVKYHAAMGLKKHLEKGAEYLGMTFSSPILNQDPFDKAYIIPEKYFNEPNKKEKQILGFTEPSITQHGFYKGTFGDLIRECKKIFKAKIIVKDNVIYMYREDHIVSSPQFTLPDIYNPYFELNTDEFRANTLISFQTDSVDKNTMQDYLGTSFQVCTEPPRINNLNMVLMKGFEETRINFALAKTKTGLTTPEEIMSTFLELFNTIAGAVITAVNAIIEVLNTVIGIVNGILSKLAAIGIKLNFQLPEIPTVDTPDFSNKYKNRVGMLKLEKDIISVNKICILDVSQDPKYTKIHDVNDLAFSAHYLWDTFHFINSFIPSDDKPNANQYYKYSYDKVPFTFDDYEKVKNNNSIFMPNGEDALIDSIKWNIWNQWAQMDVRVNRLYTNNLKATFSEPDGK
ncbi:MAG: hypothetical protein V4538_15610 [Bacteroidota bacterium]